MEDREKKLEELIRSMAEDTGIPAEHLALCDEWIRIPMKGKIASLNVSVAAGILVYEVVRRRQ